LLATGLNVAVQTVAGVVLVMVGLTLGQQIQETRMNARRLRIYLGERDRDAEGHVLHETIVHRAHERGLAGASVFRGVVGYGARRELHTAKVLRLSEDLPVVVESSTPPARWTRSSPGCARRCARG
jgi:PII-like signaling protein